MKRSVVIALAVIFSFGSGEAVAASAKVEAVIAASKRATGGTRWDHLQDCHEEGTRADGAIAYTTRFSLEHYGMRVDSQRGNNARSMGFNGKARWQAVDGKTMIRDDSDSIKDAILTNYLSINGFYFPDRFPATVQYLRRATDGGDMFDVLKITPDGGNALEVWFYRRSHLIRRVVDLAGATTVTAEAADYRNIEGLTIATRLNVLEPDGKTVDTGLVTSFRCGPIDSMIFEPPGPR